MKIIFSPYFDQSVYINDKLTENKSWYNTTVAGPTRLLNILETYLGFTGKYEPKHKRNYQYRLALERAITETSFYAKSFYADPARTAGTLLQWRDELILGGLDLHKATDPPKRIDDLQKVEKIFTSEKYMHYAGEADRWQKVFGALENNATLPLMKIETVYPEEMLTSWQQRMIKVLADHPAVDHSFNSVQQSTTNDQNDLQRLKKSIIDNSTEKLSFKGDGSLLIINSADHIESGQVLSNYLKNQKDIEDTVIVSSHKMNIPAGLIANHGMPAMKIESEMAEDPILQLLKLIPACVFAPLDVVRFTELLMFPQLPFNHGLANRFARLMNSCPGRLSEEWNKKKSEWIEKQEDQESAKKSIDKAAFFLEQPLLEDSDINDGAIKTRMTSLLEAVGTWAKRKAAANKIEKPELSQSLFRLAQSSQDLIDSIKKIPEKSRLTRLLYNQLVLEVIFPADNLIKSTDKNSCGIADNGSNLLSEAKHVIIWNCIKGESAGRLTWLPEEINWFNEHSITYSNPEEVYKQRFFNDQESVLRCKEKLILMIPESIQGESTEKGSLYARIKAVSKDLHKIEFRFPEDNSSMVKLLGIKTELPDQIVLPSGAPDYWNINNKHLLTKRDYESYSSLKDLMHYPYAWLLNYQAKIRPSAMLSFSNDIALQGTLAHRIIEMVIKGSNDPINMSEEELQSGINKYFNDVLEKEGAVFLLPEKRKDYSYFKHVLNTSIPAFLKECKVNGWTLIKMEQELTGNLGAFPLKSRLDVLLDKQNDRAVVDIKFFTSSARKKDMSADNDIQLILYAGLAQKDNIFPKSAYYFVRDNSFLAKHNGAFKNAETIGKTGDDAEDLHQTILDRMERTAAYRWDEMAKKGNVEVGEEIALAKLTITKEKELDLMPLPVKSKKKIPRDYNNYVNLLKVN